MKFIQQSRGGGTRRKRRRTTAPGSLSSRSSLSKRPFLSVFPSVFLARSVFLPAIRRNYRQNGKTFPAGAAVSIITVPSSGVQGIVRDPLFAVPSPFSRRSDPSKRSVHEFHNFIYINSFPRSAIGYRFNFQIALKLSRNLNLLQLSWKLLSLAPFEKCTSVSLVREKIRLKKLVKPRDHKTNGPKSNHRRRLKLSAVW